MRDAIDQLYATLDRRVRPEEAAALIISAHPEGLPRAVYQKMAQLVAHGSFWGGYSSMAQDFERPAQRWERQLEVRNAIADDAFVGTDPVLAYAWVGDELDALGIPPRGDYHSRLNRAEREKRGLGEMSRRRYDKRVRVALALRDKLEAHADARARRRYEMTAKSGLAHRISRDMLTDEASARFVAYFVARANRRSVFTWDKQERPFDEVCAALLADCGENADWLAIAYVWPVPEVLAHLDDAQRGELLGQWSALLEELAARLGTAWRSGNFDAATMVVRKGNDSSTWNALAGAWNKARSAWINLLYSLGLQMALNEMCPGKALRLMAADVVWLHRYRTGSEDAFEPDTAVWAALPKPWEVWTGETRARCTLATIERVCRDAGVDPRETGWIAPRPKSIPAPVTATPELVHGVQVFSPLVAKILRDVGAFSGKKLKVPAAGA